MKQDLVSFEKFSEFYTKCETIRVNFSENISV